MRVPAGTAGIREARHDKPVKGKSPGSANRRGIMKKLFNSISPVYQLRQRLVQTNAGRHPRVSHHHFGEVTKQRR